MRLEPPADKRLHSHASMVQDLMWRRGKTEVEHLNGRVVRLGREHGMPVPTELDAPPTRVLIVDDEESITKIIAKALRADHPEIEIIEAHDGFRAGQVVSTLKPDVVVLDLRMPGVDGFEVCRLIKADDSTKHAEVIAMTAYPSEENIQNILDGGARVCLTKPLDIDQLLREIETSL
ncbi:hypothetical protein LCGC14_3030210, partial [marine sediment metagenome]